MKSEKNQTIGTHEVHFQLLKVFLTLVILVNFTLRLHQTYTLKIVTRIDHFIATKIYAYELCLEKPIKRHSNLHPPPNLPYFLNNNNKQISKQRNCKNCSTNRWRNRWSCTATSKTIDPKIN